MASAEKSGERIAKVIARAGICSRRDAEKMIAAGRVSVDGTIIKSPALDVTPEQAIVVDGKPLPTAERTRLFRLHKKRGLVTTARDPQGRPTLFDALPPGLPRLISVGRLDINSEGLLLLTNDGELARQLELPATGWVRRYRVRVNGDVEPAALKTLEKGLTIDGVRYGPVRAALDRQQGDNAWLSMSLTEGKNREVRKLCEHLGWKVNRLIRVAYGPFQLGDLEPGVVEEVTGKVLREQLGKAAPRPRAAHKEATMQRTAHKGAPKQRAMDKETPSKPATGRTPDRNAHAHRRRPS